MALADPGAVRWLAEQQEEGKRTPIPIHLDRGMGHANQIGARY